MKPDKGNGVVIMDKSDYFDNLSALLMDDTYQEISLSKINILYRRVDMLLEDMLFQGQIDEDAYAFMKNKYPVVANVFGLPKIHKGLVNMNFRLIVNAKRGKTFFIGKYLDFHLKRGIQCFQ